MKKKTIITIIMILMVGLFVANPVFAKDIASCENSIKGALIDEKIPNTVSTIINVIKIVVPVLLVIFGMLDLMKGITAQKEDEIKKGQQIFVKRLIAGVLVFFVVTIVQFIVGFAADEDEPDITTCSNCFITGSCTYKMGTDGKCPDGTEVNPNNNSNCIKK